MCDNFMEAGNNIDNYKPITVQEEIYADRCGNLYIYS